MERQHSDIINDLLPRYCEGMATAEERAIVEKWLAASDENRRIAKQIHAIYLAADTMHVLQHVDTDKAFTKVKGKMTVKRRTSWWEWTQRIAAVLFIPLLVALMIEYMGKDIPVIQQMNVRTNPGMTTSVMLPDSTVVYLNSGSSLSYPTTFTGKTRVVTLQGEGYFEVYKDKNKPFIVSTLHDTQITVYGTEFNLEAYPGDEEINATLVSGEIGFIYAKDNQRKRVMMAPGQKMTYDIAHQSVVLKNTYVDSDIAWKEGKLIFRDTPFPEVFKALSKRYNVQFIMSRASLKNESFTGTFENQRLNRILEYLKISSNIKFRYLPDDDENMLEEKEKIEIY